MVKTSSGMTVGRLAKKYGLSRSTLLYYDSIGLLSPQTHMKGEYRLYGAEEEKRLAQICHYRKAGIPLKEIKIILDSPVSSISGVLEARLKELNEEIASLHEQREFISGILKSGSAVPSAKMDKAAWTEVLRSSGFSEEDMRDWHKAFERTHPERHQQFLEYLQIPDDDIRLIRKWSAGPQRIQKIKQASERYMELFYDFFSTLTRLGPGSSKTTKRALACVSGLPENAQVLDVGCGTGLQTIALAEDTDFQITAVDNWQVALDRMTVLIEKAGLAERITVQQSDMNELGFAPESLDLIWSEGAIYLMGFENGVSKWKEFLKPGGWIALSEMTWTADERPAEAAAFWNEGYPEMKSITENIATLERQGFEVVDHFILPQSDWWDMFYREIEDAIPAFVEKHGDSAEVRMVVESNEKEMEIMRKYHEYLGYVFYIARKK
ncbi:MerR family transcriptional regulator [Desulfovibrio sp. JC010]|uniref:MerR family transcriptional regulator n=1 Tax=Desulfovibrio sp. JC010 TaxID=2593641 RepID=UPI0013D803D1|nr:MerR family transcriptional regulator [Desulfovibrio sp. JC010]NDV26070.1 methyltransferase domain-containing protein [Desulfovibrio sp. JC010]